MLTMIRDGHRQVGIYQQKEVSQIGRRHYRESHENRSILPFLFSIAFHRRRGRLSSFFSTNRKYFPFPRWIHHVDFERPTSPKNCIVFSIQER